MSRLGGIRRYTDNMCPLGHVVILLALITDIIKFAQFHTIFFWCVSILQRVGVCDALVELNDHMLEGLLRQTAQPEVPGRTDLYF